MGVNNTTSFEVGMLTIAAAGTAQQLTAGRVQEGYALVVHAHPDNTGHLFVGQTQAVAEAHLFTLEKGASVAIRTDNIGDVWIDCATNGDVVEWLTEVRD